MMRSLERLHNWVKTDYERLWKVFEDNDPSRKSGKTFLACHILAGTIQVAEKHSVIICEVAYLKDAYDLRHDIQCVFKEYDIHITDWDHLSMMIRVDRNISIVFIPMDQYYIKRHRDHYYVNFNDYRKMHTLDAWLHYNLMNGHDKRK